MSKRDETTTGTAKLIYCTIMSLDGYIEDESGKFGWGKPDEEVHRFVNDLQRPLGTYLYGRRMYEVMKSWETGSVAVDALPYTRDFAELWRKAEKVVYSRTLEKTSTAKTRIERDFDVEAARQLKARAARDLGINGPELASHAFKAGLIDECQLFVVPISVGGGKRALPSGVRVKLELVEQRRFESGFVYLRYRTAV
jgi:dihydrofolate reductase